MATEKDTRIIQVRELIESYDKQIQAPYNFSIKAHGEAILAVLEQLQCDTQTQIAGLLYPLFRYGKLEEKKLEAINSPTVLKLLQATSKMEAAERLQKNTRHQSADKQIDNLKKMLLAMMNDIRVVLIKLSEQLTLLYHLKSAKAIQQKQAAESILNIYAPLANRLGIGQLKWQLEDVAFRYLHPETYQQISKSLNMHRTAREALIEKITSVLYKKLKSQGIDNAVITGRPKHIYSIYRKTQRKQVPFEEIFDVSALRILVDDVETCYAALSVVHALWGPIKKEFDDYIVNPKKNGYQSIHTAIVGPQNKPVEIQIRTHEMHERSELGVAAHWQYKEQSKSDSGFDSKLKWLRQIMDWQTEITEKDIDVQSIFSDRVYVTTPKGDILDFEAGATPLDFAYRLHTEIGHRCKGIKVNGKLEPLTYTIKTGDILEVMTKKMSSPSRDWLNPEYGYIKTSNALSKVRQWFNRLNHEQHLTEGEAVWAKAMKKHGLKGSDLELVLQPLNFVKRDDLLVALGANNLSVATLLGKLPQPATRSTSDIEVQQPIERKARARTKTTSAFIIEGVEHLKSQAAQCCKPIPGDAILGYITIGRGVTVHKKDCANIKHSIAYRPERVVMVHWSEDSNHSYAADIILRVNNRPALVRDITQAIASHKIDLLGLSSRLVADKSEAILDITLDIHSLAILEKLMTHLQQMPEITSIKRKS